MNQRIKFSGIDRRAWLETISQYQNIDAACDGDIASIVIERSGNEVSQDIEPFHIVTLACLIEFLKNEKRYSVRMSNHKDSEVSNFLFNEMKFNQYWLNNYQYIQPIDESVLNIWKVSKNEIEFHADRIHNYFKNRYFKGRDLSALKVSILELFYNIFDHAKANGNAFALLRYNDTTKKLQFAVCDLGRGIAKTIKDKFCVDSDSDAICKALEDGVTVGSQAHNKGRGLMNIVGVIFDDNNLKIVSNKGFAKINKNNGIQIELFENIFDFKGTLVYFDVSMDRFEIEETTSFYEL